MPKTLIAIAATVLGICTSSPALAQKVPNDRNTELLATFLMPIAFESIVRNCAAHLPNDSYLLTSSADLQNAFTLRAEGTFEDVRTPLLRVLIGDQLNEIPPSELVMIEEEMITGFATNVLNQQLTEAMDAEGCVIFNRAMQDAAPLSTKSTTSLLGFIIRDMVLARREEL